MEGPDTVGLNNSTGGSVLESSERVALRPHLLGGLDIIRQEGMGTGASFLFVQSSAAGDKDEPFALSKR